MTASLFRSSSIPVLEQVVRFTQARHNVLAGNVANMDTPGYRVRDLSVKEFESRLKDAIEIRDGQYSNLPTTEVQNYADRAMREVGSSLKGILYHDDSNDSLEQQVAEITKNQTQFNLALSIMKSQFDLLEAAISERA